MYCVGIFILWRHLTLTHSFCRAFEKVETIGDCYVAVSGLPEPRKDHATVMARFAHECLLVLSKLTKRLEVMLGPDTAELTMRIGLHSGAVTAGVLRGEKSRFQVFGDTVNTGKGTYVLCGSLAMEEME